MLRRVVVGLALALLTGCPGFGDELAVVDETPTWAGGVDALFVRWCSACHVDPPTGGAPMPLVTHVEALEHLADIQQQSVVLRRMPPGGLPEPERVTLEAWIAAGAPAGRPVTWADVGPLLAKDCSAGGCHGPEASAKGLDLSTYAGFVAGGENGAVHGDGQASQSRLIDALRGRNDVLRMPLTGPWPEARIAYVEAWIDAGFPEEAP